MPAKGLPERELFQLSERDLQELSKFGQERRFKKGEVLFHEGDEPDTLWMVKEGRVNVTKSSAEGADSMVAFYTPGQTFCVAATLINDPYPCKAMAATDCAAMAIPSSKFLGLFSSLPVFARRLLTEMAPQFCDAHCNCALALESVDKRLAHMVLRLDRQFQGGEIPFTRAEIAQMVNTTVETCIRVLSEWDKRGWIEGGRGRLRLRQRGQVEGLLD